MSSRRPKSQPKAKNLSPRGLKADQAGRVKGGLLVPAVQRIREPAARIRTS